MKMGADRLQLERTTQTDSKKVWETNFWKAFTSLDEEDRINIADDELGNCFTVLYDNPINHDP